MTSPIITSIATPDLTVTELIDPDRIEFYAKNLAQQVNAFRMGYAPEKRVIDLDQWISDIIIETTVQGASLLEVHVIDPLWALFQRDGSGASFIDADETGYLWPPVEVNFPADSSSAVWRLCAVRASTSLTEANVVLTFEDKIISELREQYHQQQSYPNETRAEFLQNLVVQTNQNPAYPGEVHIRFVPLLPKETFTTGDLTAQQQLPKSATQSNSPARKNPNKHPHPPKKTPEGKQVESAVAGIEISIQKTLDALGIAVPHQTFFQTLPPNAPPQTLAP